MIGSFAAVVCLHTQRLLPRLQSQEVPCTFPPTPTPPGDAGAGCWAPFSLPGPKASCDDANAPQMTTTPTCPEPGESWQNYGELSRGGQVGSAEPSEAASPPGKEHLFKRGTCLVLTVRTKPLLRLLAGSGDTWHQKAPGCLQGSWASGAPSSPSEPTGVRLGWYRPQSLSSSRPLPAAPGRSRGPGRSLLALLLTRFSCLLLGRSRPPVWSRRSPGPPPA